MLKAVSSVINAIGALNYKGTWNANTNNPALTSSVGVKGDYYVVSTAGSTNLNGEINWGVGDWAAFNGSVWQKVDGGSTGNLTTLSVTEDAYLSTSSGRVGVGTATPYWKLSVSDNGIDGGIAPAANLFYFGTKSNHAIQFRTNDTDKMTLSASGDLSIGTTAGGYKLLVSDGTVSGYCQPVAGALYFGSKTNHSLIFMANDTQRANIPAAGGMVVGTAAIATNATDGFLYVPTCAGTPTGTPTTQTGTAPIVIDTTNNKLYFYSSGTWRDAGP